MKFTQKQMKILNKHIAEYKYKEIKAKKDYEQGIKHMYLIEKYLKKYTIISDRDNFENKLEQVILDIENVQSNLFSSYCKETDWELFPTYEFYFKYRDKFYKFEKMHGQGVAYFISRYVYIPKEFILLRGKGVV